jgi:hypothetical protein
MRMVGFIIHIHIHIHTEMKGIRYMRRFNSILRKCILITLACVSFFSVSGVYADGVRSGAGDGKQACVSPTTQQITLEKKNSEMVSTASGERFEIGTATMIVGQDGKQIPIDHLLVPCDVTLTYETKNGGSRFVHRIEVLSIHSDATDNMYNERI